MIGRMLAERNGWLGSKFLQEVAEGKAESGKRLPLSRDGSVLLEIEVM
jgi:hypothetical protein